MLSAHRLAHPASAQAGPRPAAGSSAGFTLIELMITLAIIAILSAVAYPLYANQLIKSQRVEARTALMRAATLLERRFTQDAGYPASAAAFSTLYGLAQSTPIYSDPDNAASATRSRFLVTYAPGTPPATGLAPLSYTLTATPQANARTDSDCGNFSLNERGQRSVSGSNPRNECWR